MKRFSLNSFLELSFKMGKVLTSFLIFIVFLVVLGAGYVLLSSTNQKVITPEYKTLSTEIQEEILERETTSVEHKTVDPLQIYESKIDKIIKNNNLTPDIKNNIKNVLGNISEKYRKQYLNGLDKFYKEGLVALEDSPKVLNEVLLEQVKRENGYYYYGAEYTKARSNIKSSEGIYNGYLCRALLYNYTVMFAQAIDDADSKLEAKVMSKVTAGYVLGVSLLIFVILLFLPVLIKIEENTRALLPETEPVKDTKPCPYCGKEIKIDAKKCRFCDKWLNEEDNKKEGNE